MTRRLKRETAIPNPHMFTVKVTPDRRTELKVLAATRGTTFLDMFEVALRSFLVSQPTHVRRSPAPPGWVRIVFKVDQTIKEALQALGYIHNVTAQDIISAALDTYLEKNAIRTRSIRPAAKR